MKSLTCHGVDEAVILAKLKDHRGRAAAIPVDALAFETGIAPRAVQIHVKHLIEQHAEPIGSATGDPHGYYLITTADEQERAERQLKNRAMSCLTRMARLRKTSLENIFGQLRAEFKL